MFERERPKRPSSTLLRCRTLPFRQTANSRYVAVTFQTQVESAEQVLEVYSHLRQVEGLIMLW